MQPHWEQLYFLYIYFTIQPVFLQFLHTTVVMKIFLFPSIPLLPPFIAPHIFYFLIKYFDGINKKHLFSVDPGNN